MTSSTDNLRDDENVAVAARTIWDLYRQADGATYDLNSGNLAGANLYAVSIYGDRTRIVDEGDFSVEVVVAFVQANLDLLVHPANSVGVWLAADEGQVYLDVSITVQERQKRLRWRENTVNLRSVIFRISLSNTLMLSSAGNRFSEGNHLMLETKTTTLRARFVRVEAGEPPTAVLQKILTRPNGRQKYIALSVPIRDEHLAEQAQRELCGGDEIEATIETRWSEDSVPTALLSFLKTPLFQDNVLLVNRKERHDISSGIEPKMAAH